MDQIRAVSCRELLKHYETEKHVYSANKLTFLGVEGYDVYNISQEFEDAGNVYIAGRVEKRDNEISFVRIFRKTGERVYTVDFPEMVFEKFQDPFVTRIDDELVLGGVQIETDPLHHEKVINWKTLFYRGKTISELRLFAEGPAHMKDIRLGKMKDGRIAVFSRPQGEKGGLGKIGFTCVDSLDGLNADVIDNAKIYDTHFLPDEWGGANQITLLEDGRLGVLGHIAYRCEKKELHYHSMSFVFDPETMEHTQVKIIATRREIPTGAAKRPDLKDVIFSGGLVRKENGRWELYTGVSDCEACVLEIDDPFLPTYPQWAIGPFTEKETKPVLSPSETGFDSWAVYNPAVVFHEGRYYMLYRAEDRAESDTPYLGTSRIGLAISEDGIHFEKYGQNPVLDAEDALELPGGCEDPRICRVGDEWHMLYGAYHYPDEVYLFHAVSKDLIHWEKKGPLLRDKEGNAMLSKSAAILCDPEGNAVKLNGRYVLYTNSQIAYSEDFVHWETKPFDAVGFTGSLNEVCVALTDYHTPGQDDILLFFAGNFSKIQKKDYFYAIGEALFSRENPEIRKDYMSNPVIKATLPFEKVSDRLASVPESAKGTIFLDTVLLQNGSWHAYYGGSDQFVGRCSCPENKAY